MKYYKMIYGNGTHGLRVLNFLLASVWLLLMIMDLSGDLQLDLPSDPFNQFNWLGVLLLITICLSGLSFFIKGFEGGMLRFFALGTGALSQEFVAVRFGSSYPPLDVTFLFSTFMAVWFLGGCFYVAKDRQLGGDGCIKDTTYADELDRIIDEQNEIK